MEMDVLSSISKPKLPKAYSYVLCSIQLNDLLISDGFTIHTDLVYWLPQIIGSIFEVHYWVPSIQVPYPRLYVRAGALPKGDIQKARFLMTSEVLPKFSIWLGDIKKQNNYTQYHSKASPYFNAIYHENGCKIAMDL